MTYTKNFGGYNTRRYGRPWVARIAAFNGAASLDFVRGAYNGDDSGGEVVFEAEEGDVIKIGQKDHRGNGTKNDFYLCENGELRKIETPQEARQLWITKNKK